MKIFSWRIQNNWNSKRKQLSRNELYNGLKVLQQKCCLLFGDSSEDFSTYYFD